VASFLSLRLARSNQKYSLNFTNNDYQKYFRLQYSWNDHNPEGQQRHFALGRIGP
jgi:hypothetical protein